MKTRSRSLLAALYGLTIVLLWTFVISPADLWHARDQEDHTSLILAPHDAANHRVGAPTSDGTPEHEHCYICHWLRSLQTALVAGQPVDPAGLQTQQHPDDARRRAGLLTRGGVPGRSPPA